MHLMDRKCICWNWYTIDGTVEAFMQFQNEVLSNYVHCFVNTIEAQVTLATLQAGQKSEWNFRKEHQNHQNVSIIILQIK